MASLPAPPPTRSQKKPGRKRQTRREWGSPTKAASTKTRPPFSGVEIVVTQSPKQEQMRETYFRCDGDSRQGPSPQPHYLVRGWLKQIREE